MSRRTGIALTLIIGMLLVAASAAAATMGTRMLLVLAFVACLVPLCSFLALKHPATLAALPGVVVGFIPFAAVPGTGFPLALALAALLGVLAIIHPASGAPRFGPLGTTIACYLAVSLVSALATYTSSQTLIEYTKWAIAMGTALLALLLHAPLRLALLRAYALSAAIGAVFSVGMLVIDRSGSWVNRFSVFGYGGAIAVNERTVSLSGADIARASGLYVDPNSAGLFFLFAIAIAAYAFRGMLQLLVFGALSLGVLATLSRAAIAGLLLAAAFAVLFSSISAGRRFAATLLLGSGLAASLAVPAVSSRLFDSFGSGDVGTTARVDALERYPGHMAGNWFFGRGWNLREFSDPFYGYTINHAANTPLIVVYRAGIFAGVIFVIILVLAIVLGARAMRALQPGSAIQTGVFLGLTLITFQLDFPVVTMPPLALAFALVLAAVQAQSFSSKLRGPTPLRRAERRVKELTR